MEMFLGQYQQAESSFRAYFSNLDKTGPELLANITGVQSPCIEGGLKKLC